MFGTIARLNVKSGQEQAVFDLFEEWKRDFQPRVDGAIAGYLYRSEKNQNDCFMVVGFSDRNTYYANAQAPGQDDWYRRLRENLIDDPEWEDGEIVKYWHT